MIIIVKPSKHKALFHLSFIFIAFLLVSPLSVFAEDSNSTKSSVFSWASDCSAENTFVNSNHPVIPGHYEYVPDPNGKGTVFRGRLTEDFKVDDPEKVHLHPEIYFNEFHPGSFTVNFDVWVDDLRPDVLGPYTDKPWLNVVTTFDRTKLTGDSTFKPSVMVNLVGSPGAYFLQTYSISPAGEGTFFEKAHATPIFPIGKWVSVTVDVNVSVMRVRTYQNGMLVSEGPYITRPFADMLQLLAKVFQGFTLEHHNIGFYFTKVSHDEVCGDTPQPRPKWSDSVVFIKLLPSDEHCFLEQVINNGLVPYNSPQIRHEHTLIFPDENLKDCLCIIFFVSFQHLNLSPLDIRLTVLNDILS